MNHSDYFQPGSPVNTTSRVQGQTPPHDALWPLPFAILFGIVVGLVDAPGAIAQDAVEAAHSVADSELEQVLRTVLTRKGLLNSEKDALTAESLEKIEFLDASECGIDTLQGIQSCVNLRELNIRGNRIQDLSPVSGLSKLVALDAADNRIAEPQPLASLSLLREVDLSNNRISSLKALQGCGKLNRLTASGNKIERLDGIGTLVQLHTLILSDNRIEDLSPLRSADRLSTLDLRRNRLQNLQHLLACGGLQWSFLQDNRIDSLEAVLAVIDTTALEDRGAGRQDDRAVWKVFLAGNPCPVPQESSLRQLASRKIVLDFQHPGPSPSPRVAAEPEEAPDQEVPSLSNKPLRSP